jgi:hypothetical protein
VLEVLDAAALRAATGAPAEAAALESAPPFWWAVMAATRSDLRIRAVPLMPSCAATACSSGRRSDDRLPGREPARSAAGSTGAISEVSVTKDPSLAGRRDQVTAERDEVRVGPDW